MHEQALLHGRQFTVNGETWTATVHNEPGASANDTDARCVSLHLECAERVGPSRRLELWLSHALLNDPTTPYLEEIDRRIREWLASPADSGTLRLF